MSHIFWPNAELTLGAGEKSAYSPSGALSGGVTAPAGDEVLGMGGERGARRIPDPAGSTDISKHLNPIAREQNIITVAGTALAAGARARP